MDTYSFQSQEYDATQVKTSEDIILVARLANVIWHECYKKILSKDQIMYMVENLQSEHAIENNIEEGYHYFIIWYEGTAVGYYSIKQTEVYLFLSKLYLKASTHGNGMGRSAVNDIIRFAKSNGLDIIRLTVNKNNEGAIKFYEKLGFDTIDSVKTPIGEGYIMDDYIMELNIANYKK